MIMYDLCDYVYVYTCIYNYIYINVITCMYTHMYLFRDRERKESFESGT